MWAFALLPGIVVHGLDKRPECDYSRVQISEECPTLSVVDWEVFGEELYKARAMVFGNRASNAKRTLRDLIKLSTVSYGFHIGFECPLAATSVMYSLALHFATDNNFLLAQALIFMGFVFVRDKGFYDCAPWPVMGWDMLLAGRFVNEAILSPEQLISNLNTPKNIVTIDSSKIAIVSVCAYGDGSPIKNVSRENHWMYAHHHGYDLFQFEKESEILENKSATMRTQDRNPFFWKVNAVRNVMDMSTYEWILWMDCDAFFMDPARTIDSLIQMYADSSVVSGDVCLEEIQDCALNTAVDLLITVDSTGINNGVWLIRSSDWGKAFLRRWWESDILQGMGALHNCSDQSTMQYELLYENMIIALDRAVDKQGDSLTTTIWPDEVRIVPQEYMQSFHRATAESVISREWREGDFIKHHPGCHYYKTPCQTMYFDAHEYFRKSFNVGTPHNK